MKLKKGDKVKYLESDGWKHGTFDKSYKSKIAPEFDIAFVDHISPNGNKYFKSCFLSELNKEE